MASVSNLIRKIFDSYDVVAVEEEQNRDSMEIQKSILDPDQIKSKAIDDFKNLNCIELYFEENDSEEVIALENIGNEPSVISFNRLNIPILYKCPNCETHFPSEYQCQKHYCNVKSKFSQASFYDMDQNIEDILETLHLPKNIDDQNQDTAYQSIKNKLDKDASQKTFLNIYCNKKPKYQKIAPKKRNCSIACAEESKCEKGIYVFDSLGAHQNKYIFTCSTCPEIFQSAKALSTHTELHKSLKPYECDICKRSFWKNCHLWQHMKFHLGIKPFACPHEGCEARYTIRPDLKDHICKVHTRERRFRCNVCNKHFLTGSVYYQHRMIHTNDRRHACDVCDRKFLRSSALRQHYRIHTNEKPYKCAYNNCGKSFRQKGDRNAHLRTQHLNVHNDHNRSPRMLLPKNI
ncbi:unnamed protein product [Ceutorhynchus assimilis]|uniref:C2H2-type domain-containing protein n=1 Tax=Ceutorhynchus assimilis TaxID=467358 RepID=A0A9N9QMQ7_9CUCU|nr:unnamed protein product [Ceutorhynchus assimilis]